MFQVVQAKGPSPRLEMKEDISSGLPSKRKWVKPFCASARPFISADDIHEVQHLMETANGNPRTQ